MVDSVVDSLAADLFRIADTERPMHEEVDPLKNICNLLSSTKFLEEQKNRLVQVYTGLSLKSIEDVIDALLKNKLAFCELLSKGNEEDALKMTKEANKHVDNAQKIRFGLMTYLNDAIKPDTKATLSDLICMVTKYMDKLYAVYPDTDGAKKLIKSIEETLAGTFIKTITESNIKPSDNCELTEAQSNPSEYKTVSMMIARAVFNLENKK